MPYSRTARGISATEGIGRRNSIVEAVASRRYGTTETTSPTATLATTAAVSPSAQPVRVSPSAVQKAPSPASRPSAAAIRLVGGK